MTAISVISWFNGYRCNNICGSSNYAAILLLFLLLAAFYHRNQVINTRERFFFSVSPPLSSFTKTLTSANIVTPAHIKGRNPTTTFCNRLQFRRGFAAVVKPNSWDSLAKLVQCCSCRPETVQMRTFDFGDFIPLSAIAFMELLCESAPGTWASRDILFSLVQNEKMSRPTVAYRAWLFFLDNVQKPKASVLKWLLKIWSLT